MRVWFVYVPQDWQTGTESRASAYLRVMGMLRRNALDQFKGLTVHPICTGLWRHEGKVHEDLITPWEIASDDEAAIMAFVKLVREQTNQISVYVREAGTATIIEGG